MKTIPFDTSRERYLGAFKKANLVACLAGTLALVILIPAAMADYLPDQMSTARIALFALVIYGLAFASMMWIPGRAMKKSRARHAEVTGRTPSQV